MGAIVQGRVCGLPTFEGKGKQNGIHDAVEKGFSAFRFRR